MKEMDPTCEDKPCNKQTFHRQNPALVFGDLEKEMGCNRKNIVQSVKIGDHEVKSLGCLNILEKKPLGNYFGGTKGKKNTRRRKSKPHKTKQSLRDFINDEPESDLNGVETPEMCSKPSIAMIIPTKEEKIKKHLEHKIHEYIQRKEYNDRKCHMQQKLVEGNYAKEIDNLAETWLKFFKERKQMNSHDHAPRQKPANRTTGIYRSRYFFRSQDFARDDQGELSRGAKEKMKGVNLKRKSGKNESSLDGLDQVLDKLVIVGEERS